MSWRIYLSPPDVGERERELLLEAFDSGWIAPVGPFVDEFERRLAELSGRKHAVALSSGTAGIHLGLLELGVSDGDEVWCADLTFAATANAITYCGATPVFVDAEPVRWTMDPELLDHALEDAARRNELPAAIVPVDLYGTVADYHAILPLAAQYEIPVLADAAEAVGATDNRRPAGSFGDAAVFSFNGNKIITTSGGGALVTDNERLAERVKHLATQAREPEVHYEHRDIGFNYRLSNLLAAVGVAQLDALPDRVARRREINDVYRQAFADLPGISVHPADQGSTCWLTQLLVDPAVRGANGEQLRLALAEQQIEARPVWKPMHLQPAFVNCRVVRGEVAEHLFDRGLCLPSGSSMSDEQVHEVATIVTATTKHEGGDLLSGHGGVPTSGQDPSASAG